ncbi:hypothetical protein CRYUN_Cryun30bG0051600 [Craigia yunnanensis]
MASKLNNMNKAIIFFALLGLILGVLARSCVQGQQKNVEEENRSYFVQQFDKICSNACRRIQDEVEVNPDSGLVETCIQYKLSLHTANMVKDAIVKVLEGNAWT